jgi:hypothetical protein
MTETIFLIEITSIGLKAFIEKYNYKKNLNQSMTPSDSSFNNN